jgi:hypothetical protein
MRKQHILPFAALVALLVALAPGGARAADDPAKEAYARGVAHFEKGEYDQAADAFREAYGLKPTWKVLYNVGQSEAAAKRYGLALEAFETYLAQGGDDVPVERREELLAEIERLRKMVGTVEISAPDGAKVFLDGVERGTAPLLGKLPVSAGVEHRAWALVNGEKTPERAFKVLGSDSIAIALGAAAEGPEKAAAGPPAEPAAEPDAGTPPPLAATGDGRSGLRVGGWVLVGIGGAMLVAGAVTGAMALRLDGDLYDDCPDGHCADDRQSDIDRLGALSAVTDVMLFAGGAVAVTGAVLLIADAVKNKESADGAVSVSPAIGAGFGGAFVEGRF